VITDGRSNVHHSSHPPFDGFRLLEDRKILAGALKTVNPLLLQACVSRQGSWQES
jgi:hypothetical protein